MKPKYWNKGKAFLSKKDRVLKRIMDTFPNEHLFLNTNYYHSLINSIIGQQISVGAASSVRKKFFALNRNITPTNVLRIKDTSMKKCGLSRQKTLYIKNISHFFIYKKKFIKNITSFSEIEITNNLISIKGVGQWTAHMFLIFSIGSSDIFPKGDLGFIKAISRSYKKNIPISEDYLNALQKKWSPYNSMATWYLWRSLDPLPINY